MKNDLERALLEYGKSGCYPFHMPGHKRQRLGDWTPEEIDLTEIEGFDDLHHPQGLLREAQERMAELFGAARSYYLVNGSTAGILTAVCASVRRGGRILMARNCHRSVYHAVYLMGLQPEYLWPKETESGIQGSIDPGTVETFLRLYPDAEAVILTSPTYDGVVSDIETIARIVHARGIPLIVDAAHGAHFGFSPLFPPRALSLGADLSVESLHKTLPSYTQTAALHMAPGALADEAKIRRWLGIFQTSSPSYVLMAGMDRCVRMLREEGESMFAAYGGRLQRFYRFCGSLRRVEVFPWKSRARADGVRGSSPGEANMREASGQSQTDWIRCLSPIEHNSGAADWQSREKGIWGRDPSKILISAERAGLHGPQLSRLLREKYGLQMEMASGHYVTALTSVMDTQEGFDRLARALSEIDAGEASRGEFSGEVIKGSGHDRNAGASRPGLFSGRLTPGMIYRPLQRRIPLHQALDAPRRSVPLAEAEGETSAEFLYLYPPGIPLAVPGEVISRELLDGITACRERGLQMLGMADPEEKMLMIVSAE